MRRLKVEVEFAVVPIWLLAADISAQAVRMYATLAWLAYKNSGSLHPSYKELAEATRCSIATARRAIGELASLGAIEVHKRIDGRGRDANGYTVRTSRPLLIGEQAGLFTYEQAPRSRVSIPKEQEEVQEKRTTSFDAFYEVFPRHQGKGSAKKAYARALSKASPEELLQAAIRYRNDPNREPGFTCLPATWLKQDRWTDEPLPSRNGDKPTPTSAPRSRRISEFSDEELGAFGG
jgi:hypothetical protein